MFRVGVSCRLGICCLAVAFSGCSPTPAASPEAPSATEAAAPRATEPAADAPLPPDGDRRLSDAAVPTAYRLHFDIDPSAEVFSGVTEVDVSFASPTRRVDLHATKLEIREVTFRSKGATQWSPARVEWGTNDGIAVHFSELHTGEGTLRFVYEAGLEETPESFYRVKDGERWYMFSQLEAQMAREAFPCFDEPRFKTPFSVSISAPAGLTVLGNTPVKSATSSISTAEGTSSGATALNASPSSSAGHQTVHFQTTPPMPTYLVAAAVGPFERRPADLAGFGPQGQVLPHHIYTVAGKLALTDYAASVTPAILQSLTTYLGSPYPYAKLDQIGVPNFHAGAMENVGLVTYRENILLLDAKNASARDRAVSRSIIAHELAHMWFGNWVTARWWDDIWLNDAFATWMSAKVLTEVAPELETPIWSVANMLDVMGEDASSSAQPIRKVIAGGKDVDSAFDGITYQKGFAVLRMLENWMGPEVFQSAVQGYLAQHAWGTATMADFVDALDDATTLPVREVARTFIEQAGIPLVQVNTQCSPNTTGSAQMTLELSQRRYAPLGAGALPDAAANQTWVLPVCLAWLGKPAPGAPDNYCTVLSERTETVKVDLASCPEAFYPNAGELGYYHVALSPERLRELTKEFWQRLTIEERVGLVKHSTALLHSGDLDLATYAAVLRRAARDEHRLVLDAVILGLDLMATWVGPGVSPETQEKRDVLAAFTRDLLGGHRLRLGVNTKPNESSDARLKRASVIGAIGRLAPDAALERAANVSTQRLLRGARDVDLEQLQLLLPIAARTGDAARHAALSALLAEASPGLRVVVIDALGNFSDPELLGKSYQMLRTGEILPTERNILLRGAMISPARYAVFWDWYRANEQAWVQSLGRRTLAELPGLAWLQCSAEGRDEAKRHFGDLSRYGAASETLWRETLELVDRCLALKERYSGELPALAAGNNIGGKTPDAH